MEPVLNYKGRSSIRGLIHCLNGLMVELPLVSNRLVKSLKKIIIIKNNNHNNKTK